MAELETITYDERDGTAIVTLNRPEVLNAFNLQMQAELRRTWRAIRRNPDVRCVVLTGAGDRAFCTGIDRTETMAGWEDPSAAGHTAGVGYVGDSLIHYDGPGDNVGPKSCKLWKPVIAAVNGIACGGAFFMLGEVEFIVAADHATFFVPHLSYGMTSTFEATHLLHKLPFPEIARMVLLGVNERLTAARAYELGFVSQLTPGPDLLDTAVSLAAEIAQHPPGAVEAAVRSLWLARDVGRPQALDLAPTLMAAGNRPEALFEGQRAFGAGKPPAPRFR